MKYLRSLIQACDKVGVKRNIEGLLYPLVVFSIDNDKEKDIHKKHAKVREEFVDFLKGIDSNETFFAVDTIELFDKYARVFTEENAKKLQSIYEKVVKLSREREDFIETLQSRVGQGDSNDLGVVPTPKVVIDFVHDIAEREGIKGTFADLCAGMGALVQREGKTYYLSELSTENYFLTNVKEKLRGSVHTVDIDNKSIFELDTNKKFPLVFCNPPYTKDGEDIARASYDHVNDEGMFALLSLSSWGRGQKSELFEYILEGSELVCAVDFPGSLFAPRATAYTTLWVFKKKKKEKVSQALLCSINKNIEESILKVLSLKDTHTKDEDIEYVFVDNVNSANITFFGNFSTPTLDDEELFEYIDDYIEGKLAQARDGHYPTWSEFEREKDKDYLERLKNSFTKEEKEELYERTKFKEFGVFDVLEESEKVSGGGSLKTPQLTSSKLNNGLRSCKKERIKVVRGPYKEKGFIVETVTNGRFTFHDYIFETNTQVFALQMQDFVEYVSRSAYLYICASMSEINKERLDFSNKITTSKLKKQKLLLPTREDGSLALEYMTFKVEEAKEKAKKKLLSQVNEVLEKEEM